jgi:tetratricopeptide (TPR) repeat protein
VPGAGGNRPGGGGLPGAGGNRLTPLPGPIAGGNRPGAGGNRPGMGSGSIGSGNIGQIGNNQTVVNRQNIGGNTNNNININKTNNITNINNSYRGGNRNINNNYGGGAWFGGGGYGSGYNRGPVINNNFYRGGGYGRGWASPYYGSWYRGGWGGSGFWAGFGAGALTSFGIGALGSAFRSPGYGYGGYGYPAYGYSSMGVYDYFPTWGMSTYGAWGLAPVASTMLYSGYTNPYYQTVVAAQPAQTTTVYDYSQPINVTSAPPDPAAAQSTEQVFSAARDSFKAGDYQRALDQADQVLKQTPNAPVVHEFRALVLFALKRYDEAAAVAYAVLSAGPGWNWSTLVGLYPDVGVYTNQLRALEAYAQSNPGSASPQFLLGYHYLVEGHNDAAAAQFEKVTRLQPDESLSASFVKLLRKASEAQSQPQIQAQTQVAAAPTNDQPIPAAPNPTQEQPETPPPPPPSLVGIWKAQPAPDLSIALTIEADGKFTWQVDSKGQKETLTGQAGFKDSTLALLQAEGPPLVGKVSDEAAGKFVFTPAGAGDKAPGLTFTK